MQELTVRPRSDPKSHAGPVRKFVPVTITVRLDWPCIAELGFTAVIVGAGFGIPCCTVNPFAKVEICPSGFVTDTLCPPVGAVPKMLIFAVICVAELNVHELMLIPAPKLHVAPETNLLPVKTMLRLAWPCVPEFGLAEVRTGAGVVVTVIVRVLGL